MGPRVRIFVVSTSIAALFLSKQAIINALTGGERALYLSPSLIAEALAACGRSRIPEFKAPDDDFSYSPHETEKDSLSLNVDGLKLTASSHSLAATFKGKTAEAPVPQPDYGTVRALYLSQSGEVIVFGDQMSYRLNARVKDDNEPILTPSIPLPFLTGKGCNLLDRLIQNCVHNAPAYSRELKVVFLQGYPYWGRFKSFAIGLKNGDHELTKSGTPFFMGDIPGTGHVLLRGSQGFAIYDGKVITRCTQ